MLEYIERNKVLAEEEFFGEHATWDNPMADGCMAVRSDFIMNIPAADVVEVKHGRWMQNDNGTWSCSECSSWIPNEQHHYARFCLYCGAKMGW